MSVGAMDWAAPLEGSAFVATLTDTGPLRLHFTAGAPLGTTWFKQVPVSERRRRRVLRKILRCGLLEQKQHAQRRGPGPWVHVAVRTPGEARTVGTPLSGDGSFGRVPVLALMRELVAGDVWAGLYSQVEAEYAARRCEPARYLNPPIQGEGLPGIRHGGGMGGAW
ncbi:hypothetical protein [Actinomadura geliboluensis]